MPADLAAGAQSRLAGFREDIVVPPGAAALKLLLVVAVLSSACAVASDRFVKEVPDDKLRESGWHSFFGRPGGRYQLRSPRRATLALNEVTFGHSGMSARAHFVAERATLLRRAQIAAAASEPCTTGWPATTIRLDGQRRWDRPLALESRHELHLRFGAPAALLRTETVLFGVPYVPYQGPRLVMDEQHKKRTFQEFLLARYPAAQVAEAIRNYALTLRRFPEIEQDGLTRLPADLALPFDRFAAQYGFVPIAEMARSLVTGFGYDYYENVPAAYVLKLLPWLVKVGPNGLESPPYYVFPGGYQSLWRAVAAPLDVKLASPVARIERGAPGGPVRVTVQGRAPQDFDVVIVSTALDVVPRLVTLAERERALFAQVTSSRYFVTLFFSLGLPQAETVFIHDHARPHNINHVAVWGNPGGNVPMFIGYQLADRTQNGLQLFGTLVHDVFQLGGGFFTFPLYQKEWSYFARVEGSALAGGFFDDLDALQGKGGVYYVGGGLAFETVEHSARFAQSLVRRHFPALR